MYGSDGENVALVTHFYTTKKFNTINKQIHTYANKATIGMDFIPSNSTLFFSHKDNFTNVVNPYFNCSF